MEIYGNREEVCEDESQITEASVDTQSKENKIQDIENLNPEDKIHFQTMN